MASPKNRLTGITVIIVLWAIGNIINLVRGFYILAQDIGSFPILNYPLEQYEALRFLLPAEMLLLMLLILTAILGLYAAYGLYTIKSWSYHAALAFPAFPAIIYTIIAFMYMSAPPEISQFQPGLIESIVAFNILATIVAWSWAAVMWYYLDRREVKQYFNRILTPISPAPLPPPTLPVPPPPELTATSKEKKFCRYCGAENRLDAVFCEKCGKNIG